VSGNALVSRFSRRQHLRNAFPRSIVRCWADAYGLDACAPSGAGVNRNDPGDQPFWGQRVFELGVGPAPIPLRKLTVDRLSQALQTVVNDPIMRQSAADLGSNIRAEDGVASAVEVLKNME
jgi:hypothetical protein